MGKTQQFLIICVWLLVVPLVHAAPKPLPPSVFISQGGLHKIKQRINTGTEPYAAQYKNLVTRANQLLKKQPAPFQMANIKQIKFGWCEAPSGEDNTLKELVNKLNEQSDQARTLALAYLLTDKVQYAEAAKQILLAWAKHSTLLNLHELNVDYQKASFDGMQEGFCNNSWNMALDSIWQSYGLLNFSDAYAILTRNKFTMPATEQTEIGHWLKHKLVPATNAAFQAWTRWADTHQQAKAYLRYRSDNHLGWALAGLTAAASALNDEALWQYAIAGGPYDDGFSGNYNNPSNLKALLNFALLKDGQVYDQTVRATEHKGFSYGMFHLWALSLSALAAEVYKSENYWAFTTQNGVSLTNAFDYYAPYVAGKKPIPDQMETTNPKFYRFLYEFLVGNEELSAAQIAQYQQVLAGGSRDQYIKQSIGPVALLTGNLPIKVQIAKPKPPTNIKIKVVEQ